MWISREYKDGEDPDAVTNKIKEISNYSDETLDNLFLASLKAHQAGQERGHADN